MRDRQALTITTESERVGDRVRVAITADLPPGTHIEPHLPADPYLIPTVLETDGLTEQVWSYPEPVEKDLGFGGVTLPVLEGRAVFTVTGRPDPEAARIGGTMRFQPCVGGACLPPRTIEWVAPLEGAIGYSVLGALAAATPVGVV